MKEGEWHEGLKEQVSILRNEIDNMVQAWEKQNHIWVTKIDYFKNAGMESCDVEIGIRMPKSTSGI